MPSFKKLIQSGSDINQLVDGGAIYVKTSQTSSMSVKTAATASYVPSSNISGTVANATSASYASVAPYSGLVGTVPTWNQNTTGNAATATTLQTTRTINGVNFNGSANIVVESYIEDDNSTNATRYLTFVDNTTASYKRLNEDSNLTYNPSTNTLTAGVFSGALSGNASTATSASYAGVAGTANAVAGGNVSGTVASSSYASVAFSATSASFATVAGSANSVAWGNVSGKPTLDNYSSWTLSDGTSSEAVTSGYTLSVAGSGATSVSFDTANNRLLISSTDTNTVYTHPTHPGDDFSVDTGVLTGAVVVSDIDINVTTDTLGHVTDANGTVSTRTLTLGDLGFTGATNANYITNNNQLSNGAGYITSAGSITGNAATATTASWALAAPWSGITGKPTYDNYGSWTLSDGSNSEAVGSGYTLAVAGGGATTVSFDTANNRLLISSTDTNTVYTHPTHPGDDFSVDSGALTGATVISDIDINVTTDTLGHVTDANGSIATRTLTLGDLGYTGATNANYITNNNQLTNGAGYITAAGSITGNAATATTASYALNIPSHTHAYLPLAGGTMTGNINMGNASITNVNNISIADPGPGEGINWDGGNGWAIYESPNDLTTNTAGFLQFVSGSTRVFTLDTTGNGEFTRDLTVKGNLTVQGTTITNNVEVVSTSNGVIFEGSAADSYEATLLAGTLTADRTIYLPDAGGTVALTTSNISGNAATATSASHAAYAISAGSAGSATTATRATTADTFTTARTINGVSFNGSANITVEPYIEDDNGTNAVRYITFVDNSTANYKRLNEDSNLTYNPSTNVLTAGTFSGALSGNASTATSATSATSASYASYATSAGSAGSATTAGSATSATTAASVVKTVTGTSTAELVRGNMADNDQFRILVGGTASNAGYVEIATADDGTEPIYVRQYTGVFSTLAKEAVLLDGSGNTRFPGTVTATFVGNLTGNVTGNASTATSAGSATSATSASYATVAGSANSVAWGNVSGKPSLDNYSSWTLSDGTNSEAVTSGYTLAVAGGGATSVSFDTANNRLLISSTDTNTVYTHPTHPGDDFSVDSGALTGATVISDIDINVTTDTLGHVTDANGSIATRTLTLADLGYTGATNANYITNNNQLTNGAGYTTYTSNQSTNTTSGVTFDSVIASWFGGNTSQTRDKFRVWNDSNYVIGMKSGYTYGHLGDYAMSFQMDNTNARGFWWGDAAHSDAQGAMSLTTQGKLTVATSVTIGEGEAVTSPSSTPLYVYGSGSTVFDVQGSVGQLFSVTDSLTGDIFAVSDISGIPILNVNSNGEVTVDDTLIVSGSITATGDICAYASSDERLKENIIEISDATEKVRKLRGVYYDWIPMDKVHNNEGHDVGVIAQEVEEVMPEVVTTRDNGYKAVRYEKLVALLIQSNKELLDRVEALEEQLKTK